MQQAETVTYVAVTTTRDKYGDGSDSGATGVDVRALVGTWRTLGSSESFNSNSPDSVTKLTLYLQDTTIEPAVDDWFTVRGLRYDVDGPCHRWGTMGVEVNVKRADG